MAHSPEALRCLREAGRIAAAARDHGARLIRPGVRVREVCAAVEDEILRRGGGLAFPTQSSRNATAAHYCPGVSDLTLYEDGDVAKLDVGVHLDGWVVDTAVTVNVGGGAAQRALVEAARDALEAAIAAAAPGVPIAHLSAVIEATILARRLRPVANLCGHGVGRWMVHCSPPVPNVPEPRVKAVLVPGLALAIEPFASNGAARMVEKGEAQVFRFLDPQGTPAPDGVDAAVLQALRALRGLPFARHQLGHLEAAAVEKSLAALTAQQRLQSYPPLVEPTGALVAQAEHTILVGESGVEVLTR